MASGRRGISRPHFSHFARSGGLSWPQRKHTVVITSSRGFPVHLPHPTHAYIEVAQTISLLRNSVRLVIASDAARGSASQIHQEIIELDGYKPLEGILDDEKRCLEERKHLFFNAFEFELNDALHFTSLALSSSGTLDVWHSIRHADKEASFSITSSTSALLHWISKLFGAKSTLVMLTIHSTKALCWRRFARS